VHLVGLYTYTYSRYIQQVCWVKQHTPLLLAQYRLISTDSLNNV
jgi:hypothetical protein